MRLRREAGAVASSGHVIALCVALALPGATAHAGGVPRPRVVSVAAAANVRFAMESIIAIFEESNPSIDVRVTWGASGSFYQQIRSQAPFDLFLSADADYPARLAAEGLTRGDPFAYARGRIVFWVPKDSNLDPALGLEILDSPRVKRIAIANPRLAPYGRAAEEAMKAAGVWDAVANRLVFGDSIIQAAQFVASGGADAGILALSLAKSAAFENKGRWSLIPAEVHAPIDQHGAILRGAEDNAATKLFTEFLLGPEAARIWSDFGYERP